MFYHQTPYLYKQGEIIQPGDWGRMVLGQGGKIEQQQHFFREYLFERIRKAEFRDRPSRLNVVFAWEKVSDIKFKPGLVEHIYEVDLVNTDSKKFMPDMMWIDKMDECFSFECAEEAARKYWSEEPYPNQQCKEVLILGPIRIIKRVVQNTGACATE